MRKHVFLLRDVVDEDAQGRRVARREFDGYASCIWPLDEEARGADTAKAYLILMEDGEALSDEVKGVLRAMHGLGIRRACNDVTGVYVVDTTDDIEREDLLRILNTMRDRDLRRFL